MPCCYVWCFPIFRKNLLSMIHQFFSNLLHTLQIWLFKLLAWCIQRLIWDICGFLAKNYSLYLWFASMFVIWALLFFGFYKSVCLEHLKIALHMRDVKCDFVLFQVKIMSFLWLFDYFIILFWGFKVTADNAHFRWSVVLLLHLLCFFLMNRFLLRRQRCQERLQSEHNTTECKKIFMTSTHHDRRYVVQDWQFAWKVMNIVKKDRLLTVV